MQSDDPKQEGKEILPPSVRYKIRVHSSSGNNQEALFEKIRISVTLCDLNPGF